jgi:hypothetical protein
VSATRHATVDLVIFDGDGVSLDSVPELPTLPGIGT